MKKNNVEKDKVITYIDVDFRKIMSVLLQHLYEHTLTEYLKLLGDKTLMFILHSMIPDDIKGSRVDIWYAIKNELEYRINEKNQQKQFVKTI